MQAADNKIHKEFISVRDEPFPYVDSAPASVQLRHLTHSLEGFGEIPHIPRRKTE
jgi:hypothetical protein